MKIRSDKHESQVIVYDADRVQQPGPELFDASAWERQGRVVGQALGRGSALLLQTDFGPAVLRQYLRGGWPARFRRETYLFTGFDRSRPLAEFRMLATLSDLGLPVPAPLAAMCRRQGLLYRGWLLMDRILNAHTLADMLPERMDDTSLWQRTGAAVARLHLAGVIHADLNARNILVAEDDTVHLVDFDRARFSTNGAARRANLNRLKRSLEKVWPPAIRPRLEPCWAQLLGGYEPAGQGA